MKAEAVFAELSKRIDETMVKKIGVVYRFDINGPAGKKSWIVDLKNGKGSLKSGEGEADCAITMADDDFVQLMTGKLKPEVAFMQKKLQVKGNMMLAQKLGLLMQTKASL